MINKKLLYEQPDCELLVVRFEGNLLTGTGDTQVNGGRSGYGYYDGLDNE